MTVAGVLDAHVHVIDRARFTYEWARGLPLLERDWLPADYGCGEVIAVEAGVGGADALAEAQWVHGLGAPGIRGFVAGLPLDVPHAHRAFDGLGDFVVGFRPHVAELAELGWRVRTGGRAIDVLGSPVAAARIADANEVSVVLDHLGGAPVASTVESAAGIRWRSAVEELARRDTVVVKLSGAAGPHRRQYETVVLETFGAERCLWASDWPVSTQAPAHDLPPGLSAPETEAILGGTARRTYLVSR